MRDDSKKLKKTGSFKVTASFKVSIRSQMKAVFIWTSVATCRCAPTQPHCYCLGEVVGSTALYYLAQELLDVDNKGVQLHHSTDAQVRELGFVHVRKREADKILYAWCCVLTYNCLCVRHRNSQMLKIYVRNSETTFTKRAPNVETRLLPQTSVESGTLFEWHPMV